MNAVVRLIHTTPHHTTTPHTTPPLTTTEAAERLYHQWVQLHRSGRPMAARCSPARRAVVQVAVEVMGYSVEVLELALEGCLASRFCQGNNRVGRVLDDFGWILGNEARIERLAQIGQQARDQLTKADTPQAEAGQGGEPDRALPSAEQLERINALRQRMKGKL